MSSGRACVRTAMVVSSGTSSSSIRSRGEVEVRLRGRGETDLDLADAERDQQVEEPTLAGRVHRVDERLVPVAQVGGAPDRRSVEHAVGPRAIGEIDGRVRSVLPVRHGHRAALLLGSGRRRTTGADGLVYVDASLPPSGEGWRAGGPAGGAASRGGRLPIPCLPHGAQRSESADESGRTIHLGPRALNWWLTKRDDRA